VRSVTLRIVVFCNSLHCFVTDCTALHFIVLQLFALLCNGLYCFAFHVFLCSFNLCISLLLVALVSNGLQRLAVHCLLLSLASDSSSLSVQRRLRMKNVMHLDGTSTMIVQGPGWTRQAWTTTRSSALTCRTPATHPKVRNAMYVFIRCNTSSLLCRCLPDVPHRGQLQALRSRRQPRHCSSTI